jgi:hypothetical protein
MGEQGVWALMQRVERLRYRAELLERASLNQPPAIRDFLIELAGQARRMAEHDCAHCEGTAHHDCCSACAYREWALVVPSVSNDA